MIASLFKSVVDIQKTEDGASKSAKFKMSILICIFRLVDYKRTVCSYFKAGVCEKGKKCKYSHDLSLEE